MIDTASGHDVLQGPNHRVAIAAFRELAASVPRGRTDAIGVEVTNSPSASDRLRVPNYVPSKSFLASFGEAGLDPCFVTIRAASSTSSALLEASFPLAM